MTAIDPTDPLARARQSAGASNDAILAAVSRLLAARHAGGGTLLDIGCGKGNLWSVLKPQFDRYFGADVVEYDGFPADGSFYRIDADTGLVGLPDAVASVVCAVETIEHVENPRAFVRELTRLTKPGGWIVVTTPNQLSWLSKLTLLMCNEFNAFRAGSYPAHLTALLEVDLRRIAGECGWQDVGIAFSHSGRVPGCRCHWPSFVSRILPRRLSDNILIFGRKPALDTLLNNRVRS